jgi:hypothetical protein
MRLQGTMITTTDSLCHDRIVRIWTQALRGAEDLFKTMWGIKIFDLNVVDVLVAKFRDSRPFIPEIIFSDTVSDVRRTVQGADTLAKPSEWFYYQNFWPERCWYTRSRVSGVG